MTGSEPVVLVDIADRVATVTLNRPEARNALSRELMYALWDAVAAAGADPALDVVIVTGADPAFCAGVDLKEVAGETPPSAPAREAGTGPERFANGLYRFLPVIDKPVIGAVNGVAVTGGLELALQCTVLVASERARFADTHARVGIMPGGGITVSMTQTMGLRRAIELSLTGNFLSAEDALRFGLVNHVVAHDDLLPFARQLAADIVSNDQRSVRRLLAHYRQMANAATLDEAHLIEGYMAETWQPGTTNVADRRAAVTARGRAQAAPTRAESLERAVRQLEDKIEIVDLVHRYSYLVDLRLHDELAELFTEDCEVDYGPGFGPPTRGRQAVRDLFGAGPRFVATSHHNANVLVTFEGDDRASVRTSVYAWHETPRGATPRIWGYYHDVAVRTADGWRLARRQLRVAGSEQWRAEWHPLSDDES